MKILIVEDNEKLQESIIRVLVDEGFVCETASDFAVADEKVYMYRYDVLVVDINLPGGSGLDLIKAAKKLNPQTGIIVISARNSLDNKVEGLQLGADDYLTKPFDMAELVARIKALLRRRNYGGNNTLNFAGISLNTDTREVTVGQERVDLTKSEYAILLFFFSNPKRVLTRESIAEHIWGDNMDLVDSYDFIYSHIKNVRKKITAAGAKDPLKVVYGVGYKLNVR